MKYGGRERLLDRLTRSVSGPTPLSKVFVIPFVRLLPTGLGCNNWPMWHWFPESGYTIGSE
jgi:hypothetical protein